MKLVVSDSTTIITLLNIKRIDILENIFEQICIPSKVYDEVCVKEEIALDSSYFIKKEIKDKALYKLLSKSLDAGECEAIVLATEMQLILLIDEKKGRKIASNMGISIMGLLGVLLLGFKKKYLSYDETIEVYDAIKKVDFRVSKRLEERFFDFLEISVVKSREAEESISADNFFKD